MEKISILIPVYNTARYVGKCLDSILKQNYKNLEIVVVNDGSTDNSLSILKKYQSRFPTIINLINQPNKGVDFARKTALDHCTGDLIMFVDSDDTISPKCLRMMYDTMKRENVDVVGGRMQHSLFGGIKRSKQLNDSDRSHYNRKIMHEELMSDYYISFFGVNILNVSLWAKLYKRHLFDDITPTGLRFGEDLVMSMRIFPKIKSMYIIEDIIYNYRVGGVTSHYMPRFLHDMKALYRIKKQALNDNHYEKGYKWIVIELKNCLKTEIHQALIYKKQNDSQWLVREFQDPIYDDFTKLLDENYKPKSCLDMAFYRRDGEKVWQLMKDSYHPWQLKNMVKYIVSKL